MNNCSEKIKKQITQIDCEINEITNDMSFNYELGKLLDETLDASVDSYRAYVFQLMNSVSYRQFTQFMNEVGYV